MQEQVENVARSALSGRKQKRPGYLFQSTNLDLILATVIAAGLPFAASVVFKSTGHALFSLLLYYGVCCVGIVWWRKGTLDYGRPERWPWLLFTSGLLVSLAIAAVNAGHMPDTQGSQAGFLLTLVIWAPLNSFMEQLSWFYVLDAWRNRWTKGALRWFGLSVGIILTLTLISLIHTLFWLLFLPSPVFSYTWVVVVLNLLQAVAMCLLYYRSGSMWLAWGVHLISDVQLVLLAHYSLLPHL
jgi:hypothetical protein